MDHKYSDGASPKESQSLYDACGIRSRKKRRTILGLNILLAEVGLLYAQRDLSFIRLVSRGIERFLVRWLVEEWTKMNFQKSSLFPWHRFMQGRSYHHLML